MTSLFWVLLLRSFPRFSSSYYFSVLIRQHQSWERQGDGFSKHWLHMDSFYGPACTVGYSCEGQRHGWQSASHCSLFFESCVWCHISRLFWEGERNNWVGKCRKKEQKQGLKFCVFCIDAIAALTGAAGWIWDSHVQNVCACADISQNMPLRISSGWFQGSGHPTAIPRANFYVMAMSLVLPSPSKRR